MSSDVAEAVWVVGRFKGDQAKSVLGHVAAGVGSYQIIDNVGNKMNPEVIVAFRIVPDSVDGIPDHLTEVVDPFKLAEYEKKRIQRQGGEQLKREDTATASAASIAKARKVFDDRRKARQET
jgi:hypothetical protein